jgi:hypothetical protein
MYDNKQIVLEPLVYSSLFDFPLRIEEIKRYSSQSELSHAQIKKTCASLYPLLQEHDGYYYLGNKSQVEKRLRGMPYASEKFDQALSLVRLLQFIPSVSLVALSGNVAL